MCHIVDQDSILAQHGENPPYPCFLLKLFSKKLEATSQLRKLGYGFIRVEIESRTIQALEKLEQKGNTGASAPVSLLLHKSGAIRDITSPTASCALQ